MSEKLHPKSHDYQYEHLEDLIEQSELVEGCPCNSGKPFGGCCGRDMACSCKSHFSAGDCCFSEEKLKLKPSTATKAKAG